MEVKRTERGWPAHFICADSCLFRRNTLLECGKRKKIIVSTVGSMVRHDKPQRVGAGRNYETMVFKAEKDGPYWDVDVTKEIPFNSKWMIKGISFRTDQEANDMHEAVVNEIAGKLEKNLL